MITETKQNEVDQTTTPVEQQPLQEPKQVEPQPVQQDNSTILLINNLNNRIDALNQKLAFLEANQTKLTTNTDEPLKGV